jgi:hypothetical protein
LGQCHRRDLVQQSASRARTNAKINRELRVVRSESIAHEPLYYRLVKAGLRAWHAPSMAFYSADPPERAILENGSE